MSILHLIVIVRNVTFSNDESFVALSTRSLESSVPRLINLTAADKELPRLPWGEFGDWLYDISSSPILPSWRTKRELESSCKSSLVLSTSS